MGNQKYGDFQAHQLALHVTDVKAAVAPGVVGQVKGQLWKQNTGGKDVEAMSTFYPGRDLVLTPQSVIRT